MLLTKLKGAVAVLLVVAAAAGAGLGGLVGLAGEPAPPQPATSPPPREGDKPTGQPPPAVTAEQVKDRLAERQKRFRSLYVEYSVTGRPEVDIKRLWSWNMPLYPDDKREEKVGFAGDKRYFAFKSAELKPPLAPGDLVPDPAAPAAVQRSVKAIRAAWEDNPAPALSGSDYETVFDGRTLWSRPKEGAAFGRPAPVKPGDDLESVPVSLPSAYLEAIGLRPPSPRGEDTDPDHDHWPPESFKRFTKLGTRDEPEIVDGRPCLVFRAERTVSGDESYRAEQYGKDRTEAETWWLDPDLGWAPRKRELTANGLLVARWESSRFEEAGPGCWLPTAVRWTTGTPTWAAEEFRGKPAQTWAMKVSFWEVNGGDRLDKMLRVKLTDPVKGEGKREGDR